MERIILDVDFAGDDILAVLFAAANPNLRLEGVTTVTGAAGPIEQVTNVVLNTLTLAGRDDIPVHAGALAADRRQRQGRHGGAGPFRKAARCPLRRPPEEIQSAGADPARQATPGHAVDFIIETVMANPGEITLVTTGPLTNAAMALLQEPRLTGALKRLLVLGGNFQTPGNMTPLSEYNIWADPEASRIVLNADVDKILVPLDICEDNRVAASMLTRDDIADMQAVARTIPSST